MEFVSGTFWNRFEYDKKLNRVYDTLLSPDTPKYVIKSKMISSNNSSVIIGGSAYYELLHDNYRPQGGKWVKMRKEEAKTNDNDPNIRAIFASDTDDSSDDNDYPDYIDEFEYNEDGHAIFPF